MPRRNGTPRFSDIIEVVEPGGVISTSGSRQHRPCPHCGNFDLHRHHLPGYLRPVRLVNPDMRAYRCYSCLRSIILLDPD